MSTGIEGRLPAGSEPDELPDDLPESARDPAPDPGRGASPSPGAPPVLPRLGPRGWLRWAWRQLTSMRTALLLLMLLAIAAVPGSVFPQNRIDPGRVSSYLADHPRSGPWLNRIGAFDVYASPWFSAIYLLLFVSLVGCLLPRSRQHWKAVRSAPPRTPRRLQRLPAFGTGRTAVPPEQVLAAARQALRRRRYRVADHGDSVAAERGHLCETGNLVFHLSLLGVLVAIAAGAFVAWNGQAIVVTGKTFSDSPVYYDAYRPGRWVDPSDLPPFSFRLDSMAVSFESQIGGSQFAAARSFEADVSYRDNPGAAPAKKKIEVNHPLDVDGARVFLVGNGYAPVITVRDRSGRAVFSDAVPFVPQDGFYTSQGVVKVTGAQPRQLGLAGFLLPTMVQRPDGQPVSVFPALTNPRLIFTAYAGDLGMDSGAPQSVYALDTSRMSQLTSAPGKAFSAMLAPGQSVQLPGGAGSVTFDGVRRYAALDIRADPTKDWVLGFAVLALAGLTMSLFIRRRRVWVRAVDGGAGSTVVEVAGLSRTDDSGLAAEVEALLGSLLGSAGGAGSGQLSAAGGGEMAKG